MSNVPSDQPKSGSRPSAGYGLINLVQAFTSRIQLKGLPRILWATHSVFQRADNIYPICNRLRLKIDGEQLYQWLNVVNYGGYDIVMLLEQLLKPGDVFIDAGANIGFMSMNAARIVGPDGKVLAFEPEPRVRAQFTENIALNDIRNIEIVPMALGKESGTAVLRVATDHGLSRLDDGSGRVNPGMILVEKIDVPITTLDQVFEEKLGGKAPRVVKMDIEGSEWWAFSGAHKLLKKGETIFIFENNYGALAHNGASFVDIHKLLGENDYDVFTLNAHTADWFRIGRSPTLETIADVGACALRSLDAIAIPRARRKELGRLIPDFR